ncbi:MAG: rhomboid family intramembrane serine protease [Thermoprotei archaeon]|nr:MAG: rhomboid family intramembrane serine protease [Thermoprotei archaeon]
MKYDSNDCSLTKLILLANTIIYIMCGLVGGNFVEINANILALIGQFNVYVLKYGFWWQLFTAVFVHINLVHLLFNLFWIYILGCGAEKTFGKLLYFTIYVLSGLFGNILTLFLLPPLTISAGASGAIFGVFGALIMFEGVHGRGIFVALIYAFLIFMMNVGFGINIIAHLGGLIVGLIIGYVYGKYSKI